MQNYLIILMTAPIWLSFLYLLWRIFILPFTIPKAEINLLSIELIQKHGDEANKFAFINEDRAWRYSNARDQAKWHLVGKKIRKTR
ncbi:MAG: hypothetical protein HRU28_19065 [Rhizobiales bacterium]|nr:hypothetical protein [Hyphomicrobiales bacterium]